MNLLIGKIFKISITNTENLYDFFGLLKILKNGQKVLASFENYTKILKDIKILFSNINNEKDLPTKNAYHIISIKSIYIFLITFF